MNTFDTLYTYVVVLREAGSGREVGVLVMAPTLTDAVKGAKVEQMKPEENEERWFATSATQIPSEGLRLSEKQGTDVGSE